MFKLNKKNSFVFTILFFVVGIICLIFSKATATLEFLSCVFFAMAFFMLAKFTKFNYYSNLIVLDKKLDEAIKDAELNGVNSEYYGLDKERKNAILNKFIKKNKTRYRAFYPVVVVFIIVSIFLLL